MKLLLDTHTLLWLASGDQNNKTPIPLTLSDSLETTDSTNTTHLSSVLSVLSVVKNDLKKSFNR
jgi:hypothetical protein